ncbi:MAG: Trk system potassium transporter TrkA [Lachnospiraceae bacterium]|jgi:trk system potassium uptake protein TrkA|nr:Trk system potassium transporter TrkA [Lachnospiraceae bacterium]
MKIIIIGCGKVGYALAEGLTEENHDVTIIDSSAQRLQDVTEELDAMSIVGNGSSINTLLEAGAADTDLLIAVTGSDELNLLCCLIAKKQWDCHTVARVRNPIYNKEIDLIKESLGISMIINPELAASAEIARLLRFPSAIRIDTFAKGRVELLKFRIKPEFHLDQVSIAELPRHAKCDILVAGIERGENAYIPNGNFILQNGDLVSIIASPRNAATFFRNIGLATNQVKNCLIVGGGTIAVYLARQLLEMKIRVVIIDKSMERCQLLIEHLPEAVVIHGDGTSRKLLMEENLEGVEAFVALTNMDEENIMLSLFAREHSKGKLITKVNRMSFDNILDQLDLGSIIYPKYITADYILRYIRAMQNSIGSNVETLCHILDGKAEALEFSIRENSPVVGIPLKDMQLKSNLLLGCIHRKGKVLIPRGNDTINVGDTVIVVTTQKGLDDIQDILKK